MTLSNWIGVAFGLVILAGGILLYLWFRRKFKRMDGFEGFITERGIHPRRVGFDWTKIEAEHLY